MRLFGRPDDDPVLVDPDSVRNVDDAEALVDEMRGVDQRWVMGMSRLDERAGGVGVDIEADGDDLKSFGVQLRAQRLPPGQVEAASSPGCPRDQYDLLASETREAEGFAFGVGELELRRDRGREDATGECRLGAQRRQPAIAIGDDGHAEPLGDDVDVDAAVGGSRRGRQRNADLAFARALGLDRPTGTGFEGVGVDGQLSQDHARNLVTR